MARTRVCPGDSREACRARTKQVTGGRGRGDEDEDEDGAKAGRASGTPVCQGTASGPQQTPLQWFQLSRC